MSEMPKQFIPAESEQPLYHKWVESGYFEATVNKEQKPFSIAMPPPNITGQLHMGHALDVTLQDALARFRRMQGYAVLWLPGTDHASIATEVKIVEQLIKEGHSKETLGRQGFLDRAWQWKEQYGGRIVEQLKALGGSCDWSRLSFTMDEGCSKAVTEVFVRLYEKGLIYRGDRIINWCIDCHTALSDAEVDFQEDAGHLWHILYPLADGEGGITVATTRPETMLGDTAVAVNPSDERYQGLIGKQLILPLTGRTIPVVADEYVEMDFGTGAVKITPAHDPNDYEVAMRHDLPVLCVMHEDGIMNQNAGAYAGLSREQCRSQVVQALSEQGLLAKQQEYTHNVGHCYRCHTVVEPALSRQWFVRMQPLAQPAIEAVRQGKTRFVPERFEKIYFNWMENIKDWCISRQLWWGHRIPAWYCDCGEIVVSRDVPQYCPKCGGALHQDEDVLDTWFSSALWPFSTMGWPDQTQDLEFFYPTSVLVTGYDIIFFWVARMIFSALEFTGQVPFADVFIHGIVRDDKGRKMSKSLGNGIDPLEVIEKYGADALRFSLVMGNAPGNDMRFYWDKVESARNFSNKLWNASKFVLMNCVEKPSNWRQEDLQLPEQWILSRYSKTVLEVTKHLEGYELGLASAAIYDFVWSEFCDWFIELSKPALYGQDEQRKQTVLGVLIEVLEGILKLLHPIMPFVTETIYGYIPDCQQSIMIAAWPTTQHLPDFDVQEAQMQAVMDLVRSVRNLRANMGVAPSKQCPVFVVPLAGEQASFEAGLVYVARPMGASEVQVKTVEMLPQGCVSAVAEYATAYLPMAELLDLEKEMARLQKELEAAQAECARIGGKLSNEGFVAKAPPSVVEEERNKLDRAKAQVGVLEARLQELKQL